MEKTMLDYRRFKEINDLFASGQPEKARRLLMDCLLYTSPSPRD